MTPVSGADADSKADEALGAVGAFFGKSRDLIGRLLAKCAHESVRIDSDTINAVQETMDEAEALISAYCAD